MRRLGLTLCVLAAACGEDENDDVARVDEVIVEMTNRYERLADTCDHRALFALTYLRTTEELRAALDEPDFFRERRFVIDLDVVFARLYFEAFDAWESNRRDEVPPAWTQGFESSTAKRLSTFGDVLVGVSAHINRDLALALVEVGLEGPDGASRKRDHDRVNVFLARVEVTDEIQREFDPEFDVDYAAGLPFIEAWREDAWQRAVELTTSLDRDAVLAAHEVEAEEAVQAIKNLYALDDTETSTARDQHCASKRP